MVFEFFKKDSSFEEIIKKCYNELLYREPDDTGFAHYLYLLQTNQINYQSLRIIIKNSDEYKAIQQKRKFTQKYNMTKNFYGKVWFGLDSSWYSDIFNQTPLIHKQFLEYLNSNNEIQSVLEIGCGTGIYPIKFRNYFQKKYTGIDISESAIEYCKQNSKFNFIYGNFLTLNIQEKFDLVFSHSVIDHIYNIDKFLKKIIKLTNGHAYITAYNGYHPHLENHKMEYFKNDGYYINELSVITLENTLSKYLKKNNFTISCIRTGHKEIQNGTLIEINKFL